MKNRFSYVVAAILGGTCGGYAHASDLFTVIVSTNGVTERDGFSSIENFVDSFDTRGLSSINSAYTDTSPAKLIGDLRGIALSIEFPDDSAKLVFDIPGMPQCSRTFEGANRDQSQEQLEEFLKKNGTGCLTGINQRWTAETGIDPVSGNPNSLMALMVAADFGIGSSVGQEPGFHVIGDSQKDGNKKKSLFSVQGRFGHYEVDGYNQNVVQLPLGYKILLADPRWAVVIDVPLTYIDTDGGDSYNGSVGVGLRIPVLDNWSLTPIVRAGAVGSLDLGSFAPIYSASVVSDFVFNTDKFEIAIGNSVTYLNSMNISHDDVDYDYDLTNVVFRNGISMQSDIEGKSLFGKSLTWEVAIINTQFTGDDTYISNYTEINATIGNRTSDRTVVWDSMRLGASYTFGDEGYDGFRLSFGYQW